MLIEQIRDLNNSRIWPYTLFTFFYIFLFGFFPFEDQINLISKLIHDINFCFLWRSRTRLMSLKVSPDILSYCINWLLRVRVVVFDQWLLWGTGFWIVYVFVWIQFEFFELLSVKMMHFGWRVISLELRPHSFFNHSLLNHIVKDIFSINSYNFSFYCISLLILLIRNSRSIIMNSASRYRSLFFNQFSPLLRPLIA